MGKSTHIPSQNVLQGVGLGLRLEHIDSIMEESPPIPWFEVMVEDFLVEGPHHNKLRKIAQEYPLVFHSVGLNVAGTDPPSGPQWPYLKALKDLYQIYQPVLISDHLCWSAQEGRYHHDLLPFPKTKEALNHICSRIDFLQSYFKRELCLENITAYIDFKEEEYEETHFIRELLKRTQCSLLLDLTNVVINHKNRNLNPESYLKKFPLEKVHYVHLSGGSEQEGMIIDSHSSSVTPLDLSLLQHLHQTGYPLAAMIERDAEIPPFDQLEQERKHIEASLYE